MSEFFINIWSAIASLAWSDWLIAIILVGFMLLGFVKGAVSELIYLGFLLLALLLSKWLYLPLGQYIFADKPSPIQFFTVFLSLFIIVFIIKQLLHQLFKWLANAANPCALNRIFAVLLLLLILALFSWANSQWILTILANIVPQPILTIVAFFITWTGLIAVSLVLFRLFNITIDANKTCLMLPIYTKIFSVSAAIDNAFHGYNIEHIGNKILGAVIGIIIGVMVILLVLLFAENIPLISQQYFWIESDGALRIFQDWASSIKLLLSNHLVFISIKGT